MQPIFPQLANPDLVIGKETNGKEQNRSEGMERNRTEEE